MQSENKTKIQLCCPKCKKLLAKLDKNGYCRKIFLYCKCCKQEYEVTYDKSRANEPKI